MERRAPGRERRPRRALDERREDRRVPTSAARTGHRGSGSARIETWRPTAASLAAMSRFRTTAIVSRTAASRSGLCRSASDDTDTASITSDPHHFSSCVDGSLSRYHRRRDWDGSGARVNRGGVRGRDRLSPGREARRPQRGLPRVCRKPTEALDAAEPRRRRVDLCGELRRRPGRRRRDPRVGRHLARRDGVPLDAGLDQGLSLGSRHERSPRRARAATPARSWSRPIPSSASRIVATGSRSSSTSSGTGSLVLLDWLASGRRAAGERWAFDRYSSRTIVRVDGRLVFYDGLSLDASDGDLSARLGRFDVLAMVLVVGASLSAAAMPS